MRKFILSFSKLLLLVVMLFGISTIVNADVAAENLSMRYYSMSDVPVSFPATFHVKKTTDDKYAYCSYYAKKPPVVSVGYVRENMVSDNGINYILREAYNAKNDNDFFIYQTALWVYMVDKGMMPQPYYDLTVFNETINYTNSNAAQQIRNLVSKAKSASSNDVSAPTITIDTSAAKFTYHESDDSYVLSPITVNSSTGKYSVSLSGAPEGSTTEINGNQLMVIIPHSKMTSLTTKVSITVSTSKSVYASYYYQPSDSSYQQMIVPFKEVKSAKAVKNVSFVRNKSIDVIKVDESGNALKGAKLQVVNSKGEVIDSWTTDGAKHTISKLGAGTYVLSEVSAPSGYILSTEKVTFTVKEDGSIVDSANKTISLIEVKNTKTSVKITKYDSTTKKPLAGAELVIKNESGKEVVKWTSSEKTYVIKGLPQGTYVLSEVSAPDGYSLNTETITFKIDGTGKVFDGKGNSISSISFMNHRIKVKDVSISKRDITSNEEVAGATLVVKDANGKVVETWKSTTSAHVIKNMKAGTYTLTETIAPEGYVHSNASITFKVDSEGKLYNKDGKSISNIVMYNQKKNVPGSVSISKQDITNHRELAGATLVVKDYNGNLVETWVSGDKPHVISNLKPGIYTLEETIAPNGYILSNETITFTIKEDGSSTNVVMYNRPNTKSIIVENTGSFKTITSSLFGTVIAGVGAVILFMTSKKKKED